MKPKFQADADLTQEIVNAVLRREPSIDFQTAIEAGLPGLPDLEVLALAALDGRILLTHDRRTMPFHFAEFISSKECPGVFIVPQDLSLAIAAEEIILIWAASEAEEWINRIGSIPL
jgi:hypothetical protein